MPWVADDAPKFNQSTRKSLHLRQIWANAANKALREYGDEGKAVRIANSAVKAALQKEQA